MAFQTTKEKTGGYPVQQYEDKELTCAECGAAFVHSADDQRFFDERGYTNEPKRCPACRDARRGRRSSFGGGYNRQMYPVVCAQCGKETEVPFEPKQGRPVYCRDCYAQQRDYR